MVLPAALPLVPRLRSRDRRVEHAPFGWLDVQEGHRYRTFYTAFGVVSILAFAGVPVALVFDDAFTVHAAVLNQAALDKFEADTKAREVQTKEGLALAPAAGLPPPPATRELPRIHDA